MPPNIAIGLRGLHYQEGYTKSGEEPPHTVDCRQTFARHHAHLTTPLREAGYDVHHYLSTYPSPIADQLPDLYQTTPDRVRLHPFIDRHDLWRLIAMHLTTLMDAVEQSGIPYEGILLTRFDLLFFKKWTHLWRPALINLAFSTNDEENCDDNFHYVPTPLLPLFRQFIERVQRHGTSTHDLVQHVPRDALYFCFGDYPRGSLGCLQYPFYKFLRHAMMGHHLAVDSVLTLHSTRDTDPMEMARVLASWGRAVHRSVPYRVRVISATALSSDVRDMWESIAAQHAMPLEIQVEHLIRNAVLEEPNGTFNDEKDWLSNPLVKK